MKYFYFTILLAAVAAILISIFFIWRGNSPLFVDQTNGVNQETNGTNSNSNGNPEAENGNQETPVDDQSSQEEPDQTGESSESEEQPATGSSTGDGVDDFGACNAEIPIFCEGVKGKINLVNCLYDDHGDEISAACKASLERRQQLNEELVAACKTDQQKFCAGVKPKVGEEPLVDCLGEHQDELAVECLAAYQAHEAAKPD